MHVPALGVLFPVRGSDDAGEKFPNLETERRFARDRAIPLVPSVVAPCEQNAVERRPADDQKFRARVIQRRQTTYLELVPCPVFFCT